MHDTNGTDTILHRACNWKSAPHSPIVGMLIEFSVANFRSIKDEVRLSLVAGPGKEHANSILTVGSRAETAARPIRLLPSAAIYGANAAGKTNVIRGLKTMHDIVLGSAASGPAELPVTPFRFDPACSDQPTAFEVMCIADGVRYQYGFRATRNEVTDEWLYAWPSGRLQVWFERRNEEATGTPSWKLGGKLTGDREVWKRATRPQALFLSTAVSLNSTQLLPVFDWFRKRLHVAGVGGWSPLFSVNYAKKGGADVLGFLAAADLAVADMRAVEKEIPPVEFPDDTPAELKKLILADIGTEILLKHQPKDGQQAELEMDEESHGTQKMFALAGPWLDSLAKATSSCSMSCTTTSIPHLSASWSAGSTTRQRISTERSSFSRRTIRPCSIAICFGLIRSGSANATTVSKPAFSRSATFDYATISRTWNEHIWPDALERSLTSGQATERPNPSTEVHLLVAYLQALQSGNERHPG